jgi:hypothetical protein
MDGQAARRDAELREERADDAGRETVDPQKILQLRKEIIRFRREVLIRERDAGTIDEEVMREVLLGLDAEEFALDTSAPVRMRG